MVGTTDLTAAGTTIRVSFDLDNAELRLCVNSVDFGIIDSMPQNLPTPLYPSFHFLQPGEAIALDP